MGTTGTASFARHSKEGLRRQANRRCVLRVVRAPRTPPFPSSAKYNAHRSRATQASTAPATRNAQSSLATGIFQRHSQPPAPHTAALSTSAWSRPPPHAVAVAERPLEMAAASIAEGSQQLLPPCARGHRGFRRCRDGLGCGIVSIFGFLDGLSYNGEGAAGAREHLSLSLSLIGGGEVDNEVHALAACSLCPGSALLHIIMHTRQRGLAVRRPYFVLCHTMCVHHHEQHALEEAGSSACCLHDVPDVLSVALPSPRPTPPPPPTHTTALAMYCEIRA